jgi:neutral ceramidase
MYAAKCVLLWLAFPGLAAFGAESGALRAGAARIDITPPADESLPMAGYAGRAPSKGVHDPIYVRAIVLDNGVTQSALVAWDLIFVPNGVWADLSQRIAKEVGIPPEHLLLSAVHNHGAPSLGGGGDDAGTSPKTLAYTAKAEDAALEAVRRAKANLQPARFGIGTGTAYVNINRRELTPARGWWLGENPDGPSDKTVAVLKFEDLSGKPIAFFINYAVHGTIMGSHNYQITGDLPGATSRYVERHFHDQAVAVWTSGAAGDQNPVSRENGEEFGMVDALGRLLGEEVMRVAAGIKPAWPQVRIWGVQQVIACPGRKVDPGPLPRKEYTFTDAAPVSIRLSLIMLNDVALTGVSGEVLTMIHQHLKKESPFSRTLMVTHTNGSSGYIPDDSAFNQVSYEITTSHLKPGCAENAIVNGFLGMMDQYGQAQK